MEDVVMGLWGLTGELRSTFHKALRRKIKLSEMSSFRKDNFKKPIISNCTKNLQL